MKILAIETSCDETAVCLVVSTSGGASDHQSSINNLQLTVLGNALHSQVPVHQEYGGVFPSMAKREHQKNLVPLLRKVLNDSGLKIVETNQRVAKWSTHRNLQSTINNLQFMSREPELLRQLSAFLSKVGPCSNSIDAVAVTYGPGLEPALWTGLNFARALSVIWNIPLIPIDHMEGHIFSTLLKTEREKQQFKIQNSKDVQPVHASEMQVKDQNLQRIQNTKYKIQNTKFPVLALLISGGHTQLVLMQDWFQYQIIGETRDDAVGEAFDKVARMLYLPYPGGPQISHLAEQARISESATSNQQLVTSLPRPMLASGDYDFSFSGLKTAVLYLLRDLAKSDRASTPDIPKESPGSLEQGMVQEIAREFEDAVADVLVAKTMPAISQYGARTLAIGGGVSANIHIRREFEKYLQNTGGNVESPTPHIELLLPQPELSGDNAVMIAAAASARALHFGLNRYTVNPNISAQGNLRL